MERVVIKLIENPNNPKLKMKYIGGIEYCTPKTGADGKVKTGLDETALEVLTIRDLKERKKVQDAIIKEREELESILGVDLTSTSSYWDKYFVGISDEDIPVDMNNAKDRLKVKFLIANGYVAPSLEAIAEDEKYYNSIFYLYREEEATAKKVVNQKNKDKATAKLFMLSEENPNKLKQVASYILGYSFEVDMTPEAAYDKMKDFIEEKETLQQKKNIKTFLEAVEKTPEELNIKLIFDKAIRKKLIKQTKGVHMRGDLVIGNSYEEALENLGTIEFNGELAILSKEVKMK